MKLYFTNNGEIQEGPLTIDQLKLKDLTLDTPIWFEGLEDWTTVSKVEELKPLVIIKPPPLVKKIATPPSMPVVTPPIIPVANIPVIDTPISKFVAIKNEDLEKILWENSINF